MRDGSQTGRERLDRSNDGASTGSVRIEVLGRTRVLVDGTEVGLGRQDRRVLASLVYLSRGDVLVEAEAVEEHAWRRTPSPRALRSAVYRIRREIGDDSVITRRRGLGLGPVETDVDDFLTGWGTARDVPSRFTLEQILGVVRGEPFADLFDHPAWIPIRTTWHERIDAVRDMFARVLIETGEWSDATALTREQLRRNPSASERWLRLVQTHTLAGRPVEASRAIEQARRALGELGLELPTALRAAAAAVVADTAPVSLDTPSTRTQRAVRGVAAPRIESNAESNAGSLADHADADALRLLTAILAVMAAPAAVARLPVLLDRSPAEVDHLVATGVSGGLLGLDGGDGVRLSSVDFAAATLRAMRPSAVRDAAATALRAQAWTVASAGVAKVRLLRLSGDILGNEELLDMVLAASAPNLAMPPQSVIDMIDDVCGHLDAGSVNSATHARVESRRAMALRELGRIDDQLATADRSYGLAVRSGDGEAVADVLIDATYPSVAMVSDRGARVEALARVWQPSAVGMRQAIKIDAVLTFHELARGPVARGIERARTVLERCALVGDDALTAAVMPMLICDRNWDDSFVAEAEAFTARSRSVGEVARAVRGQAYVAGSRLRRRSISFGDASLVELDVLARDGGPWTRTRSALVGVVASTLGFDDAAVERLDIDQIAALPSVQHLIELHRRLLSSPDWAGLAPHEFVGDPATWDVANSVDVTLWQAAVAVGRGRRNDAANMLGRLTEPLLDAAPSVLTVTRLPLAAMVVRAVRDAELAATMLERNRSARGLDLCVLPAVHLGPSESWLAVMADAAGDAAATTLHSAATARLVDLGGRVLELA